MRGNIREGKRRKNIVGKREDDGKEERRKETFGEGGRR